MVLKSGRSDVIGVKGLYGIQLLGSICGSAHLLSVQLLEGPSHPVLVFLQEDSSRAPEPVTGLLEGGGGLDLGEGGHLPL